jgi:hypothetical protein
MDLRQHRMGDFAGMSNKQGSACNSTLDERLRGDLLEGDIC